MGRFPRAPFKPTAIIPGPTSMIQCRELLGKARQNFDRTFFKSAPHPARRNLGAGYLCCHCSLKMKRFVKLWTINVEWLGLDAFDMNRI